MARKPPLHEDVFNERALAAISAGGDALAEMAALIREHAFGYIKVFATRDLEWVDDTTGLTPLDEDTVLITQGQLVSAEVCGISIIEEKIRDLVIRLMPNNGMRVHVVVELKEQAPVLEVKLSVYSPAS